MFLFASIGVNAIADSPLSQANTYEESSQSSYDATNMEKEAASSSSAHIIETPNRVYSSKKNYCSSENGRFEEDDDYIICL